MFKFCLAFSVTEGSLSSPVPSATDVLLAASLHRAWRRRGGSAFSTGLNKLRAKLGTQHRQVSPGKLFQHRHLPNPSGASMFAVLFNTRALAGNQVFSSFNRPPSSFVLQVLGFWFYLCLNDYLSALLDAQVCSPGHSRALDLFSTQSHSL